MQQPNGLFKNYVDGFNISNSNSSNFDDASSSALLAATVYHLALLTGNKTFILQAERTRTALFATNGTSAPSPLILILILPLFFFFFFPLLLLLLHHHHHHPILFLQPLISIGIIHIGRIRENLIC